jgi:predicted Rossmann fold flavoprotein
MEPAPAPGAERSRSESIDAAVVGGGAAGLATAIFAARRRPGARVVVFDGARRLGAKVLVSGGGRCNVTNRVVTARDYWGGDRRVIDAVLRAFPATEAARFFGELGVPLHEEEDGKLFPDSNRARSVLDALVAEAARLGVAIRTGCRVDAVRPAADGFEIEAGGAAVPAKRVVLATGGLSLPKTGSDGGGLRLAAALGHSVVPTTPALAPLVLAGSFHRALAGVSHPAALGIRPASGPSIRLTGSLLWTHVGVSGPVALDASRHWHRAALGGGAVDVRLSFLPGLDFAGAERRLIDAGKARAATVRGAVASWLPASVARVLVDAAGLDGETRLAHLDRDGRRRLVRALVDSGLPVTGSRGYNYAEATAGGVPLDEVDRHTLESRRCRGAFLAGEMLDVDGRLGGFNFQWAWSSGFVAARGLAARDAG